MRDDSGFTLLEALVAFTILILVLAGILARLHIAVISSAEARKQEAATDAAENLFAELGRSRPLAYGLSEGILPGGQHFRLDVSPLRERGTEKPLLLPEGHIVTLTISWPERGHTAKLNFTTLRLGLEK